MGSKHSSRPWGYSSEKKLLTFKPGEEGSLNCTWEDVVVRERGGGKSERASVGSLT